MVVFFAILAVVCLFGAIGDKLQKNRDNYTLGFIATIAGIVALCIFG